MQEMEDKHLAARPLSSEKQSFLKNLTGTRGSHYVGSIITVLSPS